MACRQDNCCPSDDLAGFGFGKNFSNLYECTVIRITTTSLDNATVDEEYSFTITTVGGSNPLQWALLSGALPAGLSFTAGVISGIPTEAGSFSIRVRVMEANGNFCTQTLSLEVEAEVPPLNSAIYDSGRDVIFAVRGGYVYKLSATTGLVLDSARYNFPPYGDSTFLALATNVDKLYATAWYDPQGSLTSPRQGIVKINPDTLAVENFTDSSGIEDDLGSGPFSMVFSSPYVYLVYRNTNGTAISLYRFDPTTDTLGANINVDGPTTYLESQLAVKVSDASISMVTRTRVRNYSAAVVFNFFTANFAASGREGYGVAHDLDNDNYYVATESPDVLKIPAVNGGVHSVIATGVATAKPRRVQWNSVDGKIYIAGWQSNSIIVIDPNSADAVTEQTGFDSPWDVVFTPTKKWAVQHGQPGLKEIT